MAYNQFTRDLKVSAYHTVQYSTHSSTTIALPHLKHKTLRTDFQSFPYSGTTSPTSSSLVPLSLCAVPWTWCGQSISDLNSSIDMSIYSADWLWSLCGSIFWPLAMIFGIPYVDVIISIESDLSGSGSSKCLEPMYHEVWVDQKPTSQTSRPVEMFS